MSFHRLPAIFFGHGNPMHAISENEITRAWAGIGRSIVKPRAVLCISAHWYLAGTMVTAMAHPRTIHDFGGFPRELYEVEYPARGSAEVARRVQEALAPLAVGLDERWGLDHGAWSVLRHVFPDAGVPVVQLSIDETQPAEVHYQMGKKLAPLREEGIFIMGSGNLVHNLHAYGWGRQAVAPYEWAVRFERMAREMISSGHHEPLIGYEHLGRDAMLSAPTPDHYLPLLYVLGASLPGDTVTYPVEGVDGGSVSMLSVRLG